MMGYVRRLNGRAITYSAFRGNLDQTPLKEGEDIVEADSLEDAHSDEIKLELARKNKLKSIDRKTSELINGGFVYDSGVFSLSIPAQMNWNTIDQRHSELPYPFSVSLKDGGEYEISDSDEAKNLASQAMTTVITILGGGRALRKQVLAAVDISGVNSVQDDR